MGLGLSVSLLPEILPAGAGVCPRRGCAARIGVEVLGDPRQPPRWYCLSGHSGYFTVAEPMNGNERRPAPAGTYGRYTRCCSECGEPVRVPARKCVDCRSHG